jgi:hypothetical protein
VEEQFMHQECEALSIVLGVGVDHLVTGRGNFQGPPCKYSKALLQQIFPFVYKARAH